MPVPVTFLVVRWVLWQNNNPTLSVWRSEYEVPC